MQRRAYSLVELLVALAITGFIMAAGGTLLYLTLNNITTYRQQNQAQQNARTGIATIADEMKSAIRKDASITAGSVQVKVPSITVRGATAGNATPGNITNYTTPLYFNIFNDDGVTEKRVRYWLEGTNLRREIVTYVDDASTPGSATSATAGTIVARFVTEFKAQKPGDSVSNSNPLANNYDIVTLTISATQGVTGDNTQQSTVQLISNVTLRNNLL